MRRADHDQEIIMNKKVIFLLAGGVICIMVAPVLALHDSIGIKGINARRLQYPPYNLLGRKIGIGQVEVGRPVKLGQDKVANKLRSIFPRAVFYRDQVPEKNKNIDDHATMVAEVMIAQDKYLRGVSPKAKLYASAVGSLNEGGQPQ